MTIAITSIGIEARRVAKPIAKNAGVVSSTHVDKKAASSADINGTLYSFLNKYKVDGQSEILVRPEYQKTLAIFKRIRTNITGKKNSSKIFIK